MLVMEVEEEEEDGDKVCEGSSLFIHLSFSFGDPEGAEEGVKVRNA